ncbi:hypothetical protein [Algibacter lectus]|uniref:hypothetical protein n=1 Tax=Algibacter lectus TaxID=221126 RepID=UPI00126A74F0|nr:hypothetical protein [Algibacter lectus]
MEKTSLKICLILSIPIIRLSIIDFFDKYYKAGYPTLLAWFKLATFTTLMVPFLIMLPSFDTSQTTLVFETNQISNTYVLDSILIILIGLLAVAFAETMLKFRKSKKREDLGIHYKLKNYNLFFIASITVLILNIALVISNTTGFGSEGVNLNASFVVQIINILSNVFLTTIAYFKFFRIHTNKNINTLLYCYIGLSLGLGFLSGMKENVIVPIILVLIPYFSAGNKPKVKQLVIPVFILLFLYPLNNNYREALKDFPVKTVAFYAAINKTFSSEIFTEEEADYSLSERYQGFSPLLYGASIEGQWHTYKYLNRYIYLPVAWFAPRFVLPNKPTSTTGTELYKLMREIDFTDVSITPTTYGWSYLEGGYIPLFISFFLYAIVLCFIELIYPLDNLKGFVIYGVLVIGMIKIESDIYFRINAIFQTIFVISVFFKFFLNKYKVIKTND